jgi:hypothetical protein
MVVELPKKSTKPHAQEIRFLKEFLKAARNTRGHTPLMLNRCVEKDWIKKLRVDEENYPWYETTALGRADFKREVSASARTRTVHDLLQFHLIQ